MKGQRKRRNKIKKKERKKKGRKGNKTIRGIKGRCCNKRTNRGNWDTDDAKRFLIYRPKKREDALVGDIFKVGGGIEYRDLDKFY